MNRKRWVALLLTAALCASFTSCLLQTSSSKPFTIDLIVKGTDADFWKSADDGAQEAAGFYGATVQMYGPETEKFYMDQNWRCGGFDCPQAGCNRLGGCGLYTADAARSTGG